MKIAYPLLVITLLVVAFVSLQSFGFFNSTKSKTGLRIKQVSYRNATGLQDRFNNYSDWILLVNESQEKIVLDNYTIGDSDQKKWRFAATELQPEECVLAFASGENIKTRYSWRQIVDKETTWKYHIPKKKLNGNWKIHLFHDEDWGEGKAGFGYGDDDDITEVETTSSLCIKTRFDIEKVEDVERLILSVDYDDAFIAWINGKEITRSNVGVSGKKTAYNARAHGEREALMCRGGKPFSIEIDRELFRTRLKKKNNVLAIQVFNYGNESSDMSMLPFLHAAIKGEGESNTADWFEGSKAQFHCDFKLSSEEQLFLRKNEDVVQQLHLPNLPVDYAIQEIDGQWRYVRNELATYGLAENCDCFGPKTKLSLQSGRYEGEQLVRVVNPVSDYNYHYRLDGKEPTEADSVLSTELLIKETNVIRVRAINKQCFPGKTKSISLFINEPTKLPIVSIITDPANLFDDQKGIYVFGKQQGFSKVKSEANYRMGWEVPAFAEAVDEQGEELFSQGLALKVHGGGSRNRPVKSLRLTARSNYGKDRITSDLFTEKTERYKSLVLKNGGQNFNRNFLVDPIVHRIADEMGSLFTQDHRSTVVYLNGEYYGIHNIRDRYSAHYLERKMDCNREGFTILGGAGNVPIYGESSFFTDFCKWGLKKERNGDEVADSLFRNWDEQNFIDYFAINIFMLNVDWRRSTNVKFWSNPEINEGKWHYLLVDNDLCFGRRSETRNNHLEFVIGDNFRHFKLFRKLIESDQFAAKFYDRYSYLLAGLFSTESMYQFIEANEKYLEKEMEIHCDSWGTKKWPCSYDKWKYTEMQDLYEFARDRPAFAKKHLEEWWEKR